MNKSSLLSIVIPVFNEESNLSELIERCLATCRGMDSRFEILLINDGSTDRSAQMITEAARKNPGEIKGILLNRNYGQHAAVIAGFEHAKGDIIVTLDADLQNPPEEIPSLIACMEKGHDVVASARKNRQDSIFRKLSSLMINKTVQKTTGVNMTDYGCMLRAYRRPIVDAILNCHEHSTFIPILANSFAGSTAEIPVEHNRRENGESKYSLLKLLSLQFDLLTSMTTFPLRLLSIIGGAISIAGIGFGFFLFVMRILFGSAWAVDGVFTLFAILFVFIGAQFMALGLIGEYIGRIYHDVRGRPRYFVQKVVFEEKNNNY
jgi:undecaprenyl-phosphate 4-deoxy-4-formamido-L-arabinose transferase